MVRFGNMLNFMSQYFKLLNFGTGSLDSTSSYLELNYTSNSQYTISLHNKKNTTVYFLLKYYTNFAHVFASTPMVTHKEYHGRKTEQHHYRDDDNRHESSF